jgi:hypothetical protein
LRQAAEVARQAETAVAAARERRAGLQARREVAKDTLGRLHAEIVSVLASSRTA